MSSTWTKEDQAKLREYQTSQMTVKEISEKMGKAKALIRTELVAMGYTPIEAKPQPEKSEFLKNFEPVEIKRKNAKVTTSIEKRVCELREQCFTAGQIAIKLNITPPTVRNILKRNGYSTKRGEFHKLSLEGQTEIKEAQAKEDAQEMTIKDVFEDIDKRLSGAEKEPASAATDTSSETKDTEVLSSLNNTTKETKSQALTGITALTLFENAFADWIGSEGEITKMYAERNTAELLFSYGGRIYGFTFGTVEEVPSYDHQA